MSADRNDNSPGGEGDSVTFLFDTTHDAMRAEAAIIDAGYWCDMVPRPPDATGTLCGLAVAIQPGDSDGVAGLLKQAGVMYEISQGAQPD
ncbi:MAG: DUF3343 domain-containing protein [Thermoleophilia bacterium]